MIPADIDDEQRYCGSFGSLDGSGSSHLQAHIVSRGEDVREIDAPLIPTERLELARLREELKLYKLQLDNAQKEIFRAQDIIDRVESQRNEAEAEAARARTKARKLREEMLVMLAREEGRRGYQEQLSMGRRIGYDEGSGRLLIGLSDRLPYLPLSLEHHDGDENIPALGKATLDEERNDPRSHV
ncbi:hypothetical protein OG21DRAFT_1496293 [Imleria badia]|nr:hypothetical protein OG21DRAFT_1496293 [Imleria badia]